MVVYLSDDAVTFITGSEFVIDGGMMPGSKTIFIAGGLMRITMNYKVIP